MKTSKKPTYKKRMKEAQNNLEKLMKEIEPFIKKTETVQISTDGKWIDTTVTEVVEIEDKELKPASLPKFIPLYTF